ARGITRNAHRIVIECTASAIQRRYSYLSGFVLHVRLVTWSLRLAETPRRALTSGSVPQGVATYGAIDAQGFGDGTQRSRRFDERGGGPLRRARTSPREPRSRAALESARHRPRARCRRDLDVLQPVSVRSARFPAGRARG